MKTTRLLLALPVCAAILLAGCSKSKDNPAAYAVTVTAETGGTASADKTKAGAGATVKLTAEPKDGYVFKQWIVQSGNVTLSPDAAANPATFTMPAENVVVKAEFEAQTYAVTVTDDGNGTGKATVDGSDAVQAGEGDEVTLTATPKDGYAFKQWTVVSGGVTLSDATANPATFTMPAKAVSVKAEFVEGVLINGIIWATRNVDAFGTFAAKPEAAGMFYQWNRKKAWPSTGTVTDWDSNNTGGEGDVWEAANDPCPDGWRVPTKEEQAKLLETANVSNVWTTLNGVNGRKFTDKTSGKSIFFPATGYRHPGTGTLNYAGINSFLWSSTSKSTDSAWFMNFGSESAARQTSDNRAGGFIVRCVLQE